MSSPNPVPLPKTTVTDSDTEPIPASATEPSLEDRDDEPRNAPAKAESSPGKAPVGRSEGDEAPAKKPEYMTGLPFFITMGSLILAVALTALNASMLGTMVTDHSQATPSITTAFHSIQDVGWYGSSYLISNCAMLPLTGRIFAIFPLKHTFLSFIFIFEIGTLISGVSVSSTMLIIGRAISGIGGSGLVTGATSIITIIRPLEKRPMLIGILMGCIAVGQVGGPLLGGILSEVTWRWIFYINLPIGGVVLLLFIFVVRLPTPPQKNQQEQRTNASGERLTGPLTRRERLAAAGRQVAKIDFVGFFCFAAACALFLMGLEWGGTEYAWNSSVVIGLLCGGAVLFAVFGFWSNYLGDRALLPFRLLRYGHINVFCGLTALTQSGSVFILMYYLPIWFQGIKGASPIISGVMLLPTIISQLISSLACGWLIQNTGYYLPEILIGNSFVAIASGLFTTFTPDTPAGQWIGFQILGGAGRGLVMQLLITVIQANVPPSDIPIGVSYVMFCQYFAGAVFICAARTVLTSTIGDALAQYAPGVDAETVINTGVTDLRSVIPASQISGVILAYNKAIRNDFLALSGTALICSSFLGWRDIRKKVPAQQEKSDIEAADSPNPQESKEVR